MQFLKLGLCLCQVQYCFMICCRTSSCSVASFLILLVVFYVPCLQRVPQNYVWFSTQWDIFLKCSHSLVMSLKLTDCFKKNSLMRFLAKWPGFIYNYYDKLSFCLFFFFTNTECTWIKQILEVIILIIFIVCIGKTEERQTDQTNENCPGEEGVGWETGLVHGARLAWQWLGWEAKIEVSCHVITKGHRVFF